MVEILESEGEKDPEGEEQPLNGVVIDFFLWGYAKKHSTEMRYIPIHRVRSIYY